MTYEEFCTKKEIVTNNFRKDKWRTESGSFTYPRGKKTLDTLKDIIDIVFEEDELKIEKEMTLKGEGVVGTVLLASIHITKNEKKLLRYITFIITDHLFAINSIEKTTGVLLANILYGGVMENTYIDTEDTSIINEPDIVSTEDDVFHDSESVESEAGIDIEANSSSESEMTVLPEEDSADKSSGSKISHEETADFMPTDIEDFEDNLPFI